MITYALIPARGGSKGIPRKNLAILAGETLLARCIRTADESGAFGGNIFVSTDDQEIANHACDRGAKFIIRPPELADDNATTEIAMLHALGHWKHNRALPDILVMLQCTAPFMVAEDIQRCVFAVTETDCDHAFAASRFHGKLWRKSGVPIPVNHGFEVRGPRQLGRDRQFLEAGSVYAVRVAEFLKYPTPTRFCGLGAIIDVDPERVFEIDEPWQLERAREIA